MNTPRPLSIILILTVMVGFALSGCQTIPPVTLSNAVDRANDLMRSSGRPPSHYDVPNAYYRIDEGGWLVIYQSRQGYVRRFVYVFVPDNAPAQFTHDLPRPAIDEGYYNHP